MNPFDLIGLTPLMERTAGSPDIVIGLIDGPLAAGNPDFTGENLRGIPGKTFWCDDADSRACRHGTFIAGILNAQRSSRAPAICPGCTLLVRPVFPEFDPAADLPETTPAEVASAIVECTDHGARILNLSLAIEEGAKEDDRVLEDALSYAGQKGAIVIAAAGNQGFIGGSPMTRHPGVIPVVACDRSGRPMPSSTVAGCIGRKGLMAPGEKIPGTVSDGQRAKLDGTSTAAAFATGATALLWSESPRAGAAEIKAAIAGPALRPRSVFPPLLNAWEAYRTIRENILTGRVKRYRRRAA